MVYQYLPVFRQFYRLMFSKLFDDGIIRWEIRTSLEPVYDETGHYLTQQQTLDIILEELKQWKLEDIKNREIFSFGIIIQGIRSSSILDVTNALTSAYLLQESYPEVIIGFDLVGQEDPGHTLLYWAPILLEVTETIQSNRNSSYHLPYFFHAGESCRLDVQINLLDALLLNTSRIGHGYGVAVFPGIWPMIAQKGVLIEANPISNQVLGLLVDSRNHPIGHMLKHALHNGYFLKEKFGVELPKDHPMSTLLASHPYLAQYFSNHLVIPSLTVSINNDDPGFWGIDATVSYDWYVAVLSWELNLGAIKQIAIDSILHSTASNKQKARMLEKWFEQWESWIEQTIQQLSL
jgi:adenosine deaminase CECR1